MHINRRRRCKIKLHLWFLCNWRESAHHTSSMVAWMKLLWVLLGLQGTLTVLQVFLGTYLPWKRAVGERTPSLEDQTNAGCSYCVINLTTFRFLEKHLSLRGLLNKIKITDFIRWATTCMQIAFPMRTMDVGRVGEEEIRWHTRTGSLILTGPLLE